MKYIKRLNINFDEWDEIDNDNNLVNFFHQEDLEWIKLRHLEFLFKPYIILVDRNGYNNFVNYVRDNNYDIVWSSGNLPNEKDINNKGLFDDYNFIYLMIGKYHNYYVNNLFYVNNTPKNNKFFRENKKVKILKINEIY